MSFEDEVISDSVYDGQKCPYCGSVMFPADDHGRYTCICQILGGDRFFRRRYLRPATLPQTDPEKPTAESVESKKE